MKLLKQNRLRKKQPDLMIIAGEHSGDEHAARLLEQALEVRPELDVVALGGKHLEASGSELLFDLTAHSVLGFVDVLKNYSFFKQLMAEVLEYIEQERPKRICFVDYPGMNLRIAKALYQRGLSKKAGGDIELYFYVSPQIWAWKAGRRFKMAKWLDALGVIFPFELDCYSDTTLPVEFLGHPFMDKAFENPFKYDSEGPVLLLPGSRKDPVKRILPILVEAWRKYAKKNPNDSALICAPTEAMRDFIVERLRRLGAEDIPVQLIHEQRFGVKAAMASSGTVSLMALLAGVPGVLVYRAHPVTFTLGRMVVKLDRLGIANILLGEFAYPEFIQGDATGEKISAELNAILSSPERIELFESQVLRIKEMLSEPAGVKGGEWLAG